MRRRLAYVLLGIAAGLIGCGKRAPSGSGTLALDPSARVQVAVPAASSEKPRPPPKVLASTSADAAAPARARPPRPEPEAAPRPPASLIESPPRAPAHAGAAFRGPVDPALDASWIERLSTAKIVEITPNRGGATITLRMRFSDGARAAFKPEQTHSASNYVAEVAAYHVDRLLGFGRTAVVVRRSIGHGHLRQHLEHAQADPEWLDRFQREVVVRGERVMGAAIAWHSGRLTSAEPPQGWIESLAGREPLEPGVARRAAEWTDMLIFDFLIDNTDRWSGGNILALGADGPLIFLDNAAGFRTARLPGPFSLPARVEKLCRFRRETLASLREVGPAAPNGERLGPKLRASLAREPGKPLLGAAQYAALDARVALLLEHVDRCSAELGDRLVLSL